MDHTQLNRRIRQRREQEEEMTHNGDFEGSDWEFKIIRSATGAFRNTLFTQKILDEEAQSGWEMIEKFDNSRIRLKRRKNCELRHPSIDPYRIHIGMSPGRITLLVFLLFFLLPLFLFFVFPVIMGIFLRHLSFFDNFTKT